METVGFPAMALSAASAASLAEVITLPLDTAKVRLQTMTKGFPSAGSSGTSHGAPIAKVTLPKGVTPPKLGSAIPHAAPKPMVSANAPGSLIPMMLKMAKDEGPSSLWKGLGAGLHRQLVYATFRMATYPHIRDFYDQRQSISGAPEIFRRVLAGMTAGALGMTIANPTELVKVRLQADKSSGSQARYRGATAAYVDIIKKEGVLGLWTGLGPNIVRNMIVCAAEMAAYDEYKVQLLKVLPDGLPVYVLAGFGAGFTATVIGSPVDVVKTRYMNAYPGEFKSVGRCMADLLKTNGVKGFYKGFVPNCLRISTFNMLVFVFYEKLLPISRRLTEW